MSQINRKSYLITYVYGLHKNETRGQLGSWGLYVL